MPARARALPLLTIPRQVHKRIGMVDGRKKNIQKIQGTDFQAGGIDAGMAADVFMTIDYRPVDQKLYLVFPVIHQTQNADRTWGNVQIFFHIFFAGKGQAGAADLAGQNGGFEFLHSRHHEKIEFGFLGIAEKKIFTDLDTQKFVYIVAVLNGGSGRVIHPQIGYAQLIQQIIGAQLLGKTALSVGRAAAIQDGIDVKEVSGGGLSVIVHGKYPPEMVCYRP